MGILIEVILVIVNSKQISNCIFFLVTCKARLYIWVQPHIKSLFRRGRNTAVCVFRHTIVTNFVMYLPTLWKVPYLLLIHFIRYITFIVHVYMPICFFEGNPK